MKIKGKKAITLILTAMLLLTQLTFSGEDIDQYDDVTRILYDSEVHVCLDTATATINAPSAWESGYTGKGVTLQ